MPLIKNPRQEKFAQLVASGKYTQTAAYREVYPSSRRWKDITLHPRASRLMCKVYTRIQELQTESAQKATVERAEIIQYLSDVIFTPIGKVTDQSNLVQEFVVRGDTVLMRMPSKLDAVDKLCKMLGYYEPEKQNHAFRFKPDAEIFTLLEKGSCRDE